MFVTAELGSLDDTGEEAEHKIPTEKRSIGRKVG